ncbi:hypothetical protein N800_04490 [Lysobacter daejeonensis GH1-9]|uniref:Transferase n=1 Tax=Lysobacter daejeonensis GH1-9 TaxID=1385517 RepID=A0A0A0EUZ7_9GAMM|nr:glycosyltransferase [Lysobacter daejeonensis]KGM54329.1 hypothetical protein N800_04490 [Lysobacter daejeonensis GH1-9]
MRVLVVHNAYQQRGGEDAVVLNEVTMLRAKGHDVHLHLLSNEKISGWMGRFRAACAAVFSIASYRRISVIIDGFKPDVVHVHNFFPLMSPAVFYACARKRVPSIFTLHNYRIVCPTALLMHDGVVTERSLREGPWWAVSQGVYRGSWLGTAALATMISVHRRIGTWSRRVTRFIALTGFAASKFAAAGIPGERISVKSNFVDVPLQSDRDRSGFLFAGRLSPEKGVEVLVDAVKLLDGALVKIAGGGPLEGRLSGAPGLIPLGVLGADAMYREMASSQALILPSVWYEGFPMVLVEAYACGLPVIASRLGAMAELVDDGVTGLLFDPGSADDLARKMRWAMEHPEAMARMGRAARARYEAEYTQEINYSQLVAIYRDAMDAVGRTE